MADINRELEELAELTQTVNREFSKFGQLTKETADELHDAKMKEKYGVENATKATAKGAEAVINLGKAMNQAASSMYQGKKGAAAFNDSVDSLTTAAQAAAAGLMLLAGPLGLLAAAVLGGIAALGKYTQAANEMSDKLYKGYQGLAESGAAASDGMTGLFNDAKKLSLSMNDLDGFVQLIGENAKDLALFSGTVFEGRKKFADMGQSMEKYQAGLFNMGLSVEQVNSGMMGYLKLQSRVGLSQNKTTDQLADGARKYLLEMDALSKVTGESRKAIEDQMEAARSEERFAAKLQTLRSQGREAEADQLELANIMLAKENKQLAQGFRDASTGMITTEAAQKAMLVTQGQVMVQSDRMSKGLAKAGEGATIIGQAAGRTAKAMTPLAMAGAYGSAFGDYASDIRSGQQDYNKSLIEAEKERDAQGAKSGKAADAAVQAQTNLRRAQIAGNNATERFVFEGIVPATKAMEVLAKTTTAGTESLNKFFGIGKKAAPEGPKTTVDQAKKDLTASTEKAALANERAAAAEKDANLTRAEKDRIKKEARESEAAVTQDIVKQREAYLREKNARSAARRAGTVAPASTATTATATPTPGPTGVEGGTAAPKAASAAKVIAFGSGSGSAQSFDGLHDKLSTAVTAAAEEYNAATGNKIKLNSAKRDPEKQKELYDAWVAGGKKGMPVAPPGTSLHEKGLAVDIQNYNDPAAVAAMNRQGLQQKVPNDPVHFSFDGGGVIKGPENGYKPNVTMHGEEAIIPLKDGAVPVSLNLKEALGGATFGGHNEYAGYNQGPMSTDLDAVKKIASAAGAFDRATETITNPEMWKQVLSSGLATNYQMGTATLGTKGIEGLGDDIAERLKEIQEQSGADSNAALQQVTAEFKTAMAQLSQQLAENAKTQNQDSMSGIAALLEDLVSATKSGVSVQQKILATNY